MTDNKALKLLTRAIDVLSYYMFSGDEDGEYNNKEVIDLYDDIKLYISEYNKVRSKALIEGV